LDRWGNIVWYELHRQEITAVQGHMLAIVLFAWYTEITLSNIMGFMLLEVELFTSFVCIK